MKYPIEKLTRQKAQDLVLDALYGRLTLSTEDLQRLYHYLAPPLPPKKANSGFDYVCKLRTEVHVLGGVATAQNESVILQAATDKLDGLYDGVTGFRYYYAGDIKKVNMRLAGMATEIVKWTKNYVVTDSGEKYSAHNYELAANGQDTSNLRTIHNSQGKLIGLAGECDVGSFILKAEK